MIETQNKNILPVTLPEGYETKHLILSIAGEDKQPTKVFTVPLDTPGIEFDSDTKEQARKLLQYYFDTLILEEFGVI